MLDTDVDCIDGTYINSDKMDLGVTVLASLGGRHVDDLARSTLDNDMTVLPKCDHVSTRKS
jgi:hypothetical protein